MPRTGLTVWSKRKLWMCRTDVLTRDKEVWTCKGMLVSWCAEWVVKVGRLRRSDGQAATTLWATGNHRQRCREPAALTEAKQRSTAENTHVESLMYR